MNARSPDTMKMGGALYLRTSLSAAWFGQQGCWPVQLASKVGNSMMYPVAVTADVPSESNARHIAAFTQASRKFSKAHQKSWFNRFWAFFTHRSTQMLDLHRIETACSIRDRRYVGVRTVPIAQIRGSENRSEDFDIEFNPRHTRDQERWTGIAIAMLQDVALPPVELIQVGDNYFVRDGHHRISAARALGQEAIDAVVTLWTLNCEC